MGADLYIESITKKARAEYQADFDKCVQLRNTAKSDKVRDKYQRKVDKAWDAMYPRKGYFRDSYNNSNLLWQFDLSWWQDISDGYLDEQGYMPPAKAKELRDLIASKELPNPSLKLQPGENAEEVYAYFADKKIWLLAFLDKAIELKEPIYCSI
jgi:hypothetical protein